MTHARWMLRILALMLILIGGLAFHAVRHSSGAAIAKAPPGIVNARAP